MNYFFTKKASSVQSDNESDYYSRASSVGMYEDQVLDEEQDYDTLQILPIAMCDEPQTFAFMDAYQDMQEEEEEECEEEDPMDEWVPCKKTVKNRNRKQRALQRAMQAADGPRHAMTTRSKARALQSRRRK